MKILHISDLHFEGTSYEEFYTGVRENLDKIRKELIDLTVDFMIVTGDLTTRGCVDKASLLQAKEWLDSIKIPYISIPGNHDTGANESRSKTYPDLEYYEPVPFSNTNFGQLFKQPPVIEKNMGEFIIIGIVLRENDPDGALTTLAKLLNHTSKPVLLFGHYPVVQARETGILATFGYDESIPKTATELRRIIKEHSNVKVYACGHIHANTVRKIKDSCIQVSTGGLGPGPSVFRIYNIADGILSFKTYLGAGPLDFWHRFDTVYSYTAEYHLGAARERSGYIQFK